MNEMEERKVKALERIADALEDIRIVAIQTAKRFGVELEFEEPEKKA